MTDIIQEIEKLEISSKRIPKIKSGDVVRLVQTYTEKDKERHAVFEGMVIAMNSGSNTRRTMTIRRVIDGVGVEKIVPLYLSNISKIEVLKSSKTRRAKLYYLRKLSGKKARLKEKGLDKEVVKLMAIREEEKSKAANLTNLTNKTNKSKAKTNDQAEKKAGK